MKYADFLHRLAQHQYYNEFAYWHPVPELNHSDADVTIVFVMGNAVSYQLPVNDPIFAAHKTYTGSGQNTVYYSDEPVTALGCAQQHEFCLPTEISNQGNIFCSGLSSTDRLVANLQHLWYDSAMNENQWDTALRISDSVGLSSFYWIIEGPSSLNATGSLLATTQTAYLPDNQWQIEVDAWFAVAYAYLQTTVVQYAAGQSNYEASLITPPSTPYGQAMCNKQIIRSAAGYICFSTLGIALIIAIGGTIIIISFFTEHIASLIQQRMLRHSDDVQRAQYCSRAWRMDKKFQLQRKAFQECSLGQWEETAAQKEIPRKGPRNHTFGYLLDYARQGCGERSTRPKPRNNLTAV